MKPEEQAKAVAEELKRRNPGFAGKVEPAVPNGRQHWEVTGCAAIRDLSPLQAIPSLKKLTLHATRGNNAPSLDLTPLKGLALESLNLEGVNVTDLSPLKGIPLTSLRVVGIPAKDLSPLRGMKLESLICDLPVDDLAPLQGMPLRVLYVPTAVTDLTPLKGMPLKNVRLQLKWYKGAKVLRDIPTLINDKEREEFWKEYDARYGAAKLPPLDRKWVEAVKAKSPEEQVRAVAEELKRRNPGFDGKVSPEFGKDGQVTTLNISGAAIGDLTPVRALPRLEVLDFVGKGADGPLLDLSPLEGLPLVSLILTDCKVAHLAPLEGMPLRRFGCVRTPVKDLSPLKGMQLVYLVLNNAGPTDLTPLEGMPLRTLTFTPTKDMNLEFLRTMKTLESINEKTPAEFWKQYDAMFGPPK
jgi:Leucine-rich repeat (LRR) protein